MTQYYEGQQVEVFCPTGHDITSGAPRIWKAAKIDEDHSGGIYSATTIGRLGFRHVYGEHQIRQPQRIILRGPSGATVEIL